MTSTVVISSVVVLVSGLPPTLAVAAAALVSSAVALAGRRPSARAPGDRTRSLAALAAGGLAGGLAGRLVVPSIAGPRLVDPLVGSALGLLLVGVGLSTAALVLARGRRAARGPGSRALPTAGLLGLGLGLVLATSITPSGPLFRADLAAVASVLANAVPGALVGAHLVSSVPDRALRAGIACVLIGATVQVGAGRAAAAPAPAADAAPIVARVHG